MTTKAPSLATDGITRKAAHTTQVRTMFMVQKYATMITFICGLFLNLSLIFFGEELTLSHVFTRAVDLFLLAGMLISAVLGWWVLPYVQFANAAARRFQIVILIYFVLLCLVHTIVIQILGNTTLYVNTFLHIPGYAYTASAIFIVMLAFTGHLRLRDMSE
jgi:hypothetical protein